MPVAKKTKPSQPEKLAKSHTCAKRIHKKISSLKKSKTKHPSSTTVKSRPTVFDPSAIEKYLSITDSIVVALDTREQVTLINEAGCKLLGYEKNKIIGKIWSDHFIPSVEKKRNRTLFKKYRSGQLDPTGYVESQILTKDGKKLVVAWDTVLTKDKNGKMTGIFCFGRDITERLQTEKALGQSERDLSMAQKIAGLGSMVHELKSNNLRWSDETYKVFGLAHHEFNGTYEAYLSAVHPEDREWVDQTKQISIREKKPYSIDHRIVLPDGRVRIIHVEAKIYYDDRGNPLQARYVVQDITERKEVEKELKKYQEQLMHAEKLSSIGKLSASIAHEVNNPLFGIRNVLERTKLVVDMKPEDMNFIDMAIGETDRIANLIKRLNDFYRPTTGKKERLKIHRILDEIILLTQKELLQRNIKLKTHFDDDLPVVTAVSDQIKQVMLNLIQNAMDASKKKGGKINIKTSHGDSQIKIQIQDNGMGMTPEITEQIFNPFFTTKSKVVGTGLGLSVSYGIIQSHGGTIEVESTPGKGSRFTVLLPVKSSKAFGALALFTSTAGLPILNRS